MRLRRCLLAILMTLISILTASLSSASDSSHLIINEIMFNPIVADAGDEWIEIFNPTNKVINVNVWTISNRAGTAIATLPNWDIPNGTYLVVYFGNGTNDDNFSDGSGYFYTGNNIELFNNSEDECALYNNTPSASSIVDFISWSSHGSYSGGTAHDYAVAAGIWDSGDYFDIMWNVNGILDDESIGRDKHSTDTNQPDDWDDHGGVDAYFNTLGTSNRGPLVSIYEGIMTTQAKINHFLVYQGFNIIYANHTNIQELEEENNTFVYANHYFLTEYENNTVIFQGTGSFHWFAINSTSWEVNIDVNLSSNFDANLQFNYSSDIDDLDIIKTINEKWVSIYSTQNYNLSYQENSNTLIIQKNENTFEENTTLQIIDDSLVKNVTANTNTIIHSDTWVETWKYTETLLNNTNDTTFFSHYNTFINSDNPLVYESIFENYTITSTSNKTISLIDQGLYKVEKVSENNYYHLWNITIYGIFH